MLGIGDTIENVVSPAINVLDDVLFVIGLDVGDPRTVGRVGPHTISRNPMGVKDEAGTGKIGLLEEEEAQLRGEALLNGKVRCR